MYGAATTNGAARHGPYNTPSHANVFIGQLPAHYSTEDLILLFQVYGDIVSCKAVTEKGCGFVKFSSPQQAQAAINGVNGQEGMLVKLADNDVGGGKPASVAKPVVHSAPVAVKLPPKDTVLQVKYQGNDQTPSDNLYMAGLPIGVGSAALTQLFTGLGLQVQRSRINPDTKGLGYTSAMVQVRSIEEASQAIEYLNGQSSASLAEYISTEAAVIQPAIPGRTSTLTVKYVGDGKTPSDNLYISGLPISTDLTTLNDTFTNLGLSVQRSRLIPDTKGTGIGVAMVQLASVDEAAAAIEQLNGKTVECPGAQVGAAVVKPPPSAAGATSGGDGRILEVKYAGDGSPSDNLYIKGLPTVGMDSSTLHAPFELLGLTVVRSRFLMTPDQSQVVAAMVQLSSQDDAAIAIDALNGQAVFLESAAETRAAPPPTRALQHPSNPPVRVPPPSSTPKKVAPPPHMQQKTVPPPIVPRTPPVSRLSSTPPSVVAPPARAASPTNGAPQKITVKYAGQEEKPSDNLYISGLPGAMDQASLQSMFENFQFTVVRSRLMPSTRGRDHPCAAMVQLVSQAEAEQAIEVLNGQEVVLESDGNQPADGGTGSSLPSVVPPPAKVAKTEHTFTLTVKYAGAEQTPSDNLYIAGLPPSTDQATLVETFTSLGFAVVRSRLLPDNAGRGNCAAMVQLTSAEDAASAISQLNGQQVLDKEQEASGPRVVPAPPKPSGNNTGATQPSLVVKYAGDGVTPSDNLYITGLPVTINQDTLNTTFLTLGLQVVRSRIIPDIRGTGKGAAMVQLRTIEEADSAIEQLNGQIFAGFSNGGSVCAPQRVPPPKTVASATQYIEPDAGVGTLTVKFAGPAQTACDNLYMMGFPGSHVDNCSLEALFGGAGFSVVRCKCIPDTRGTGVCGAMVQLQSVDEAILAKQHFHGQEVRLG